MQAVVLEINLSWENLEQNLHLKNVWLRCTFRVQGWGISLGRGSLFGKSIRTLPKPAFAVGVALARRETWRAVGFSM